MSTVTELITLEVMSCGECGIQFGVPANWVRDRRGDHRTWYCPNGHPRHFPGKSTEEKLRSQLAAAQEREETLRSQRDCAENSKRAYRGHLTRLRRRIAHGVCPCCGRTFKQLSQHMERMHPDYVEKHGTHDKSEAPAA